MKFLLSVLLVFGMTASTSAWAAAALNGQLVFIVNSGNPVAQLTVKDIRDYYFKIRRQWPNGEDVRFVDRGADSDVRKVFLSSVLQKTASEVENYWIGQKLYTGNSAPLQQSSEALTIQFVSSLKGAIGYVSPSTELPKKGVKTIDIKSNEE